jgi:protein-disulfide isomerase
VKLSAVIILLSAIGVIGLSPSNASASACRCGAANVTPLAWIPNGTRLLVRAENSTECKHHHSLEEYRVKTRKRVRCYDLSGVAGKPVDCHALTDRVMAKHSLRDTGLLRVYRSKAHPLPSRRVQVSVTTKRKSDMDEARAHIKVRVRVQKGWKTIWAGEASPMELVCETGDDVEESVELDLKVWPSPNGKDAIVTFNAFDGESFETRMEWVKLPATFRFAVKKACGPKVDKSSGTAKQPEATKKNAGPKASCDAYAKTLCGMAGEKTATCGSIKTVLGLLPAVACDAGMKDTGYTKTQLAGMKKACDELVTKLCKDLGPKSKTCAMVRNRTKSFPPDRCTQMMGKYPQVIAQLKKMEAKNKPLSPALAAAMGKTNAASFGPKNAKVLIVEFSDFQCPYCSRAAKAANQIKAKYGKQVRFVFRQFPLGFHKDAHLAAQASLAADAQGKFWAYHDILFENMKALKRDNLDAYAKKLGLNMAKFKKALDEGTFKKAVDADIAIGKSVNVSGTPSMFINGARVANATDFGSLSKEIEAALKK